MSYNINLKILESHVEIEKNNDNISNKAFNFITKANELVELSDGDYQIEKTLMLNKISLKGYVLDSDCCIQLNNNNIKNYSINELKEYLIQFEKNYHTDCSRYSLALSLYELIEDIEKLADTKIELEVNELNKIMPNIDDIKNTNKDEYENLYYDFKNQIDEYYKSKKINEKSYNICIQMLNDIFNFYISGYPIIPEEYLYHIDN